MRERAYRIMLRELARELETVLERRSVAFVREQAVVDLAERDTPPRVRPQKGNGDVRAHAVALDDRQEMQVGRLDEAAGEGHRGLRAERVGRLEAELCGDVILQIRAGIDPAPEKDARRSDRTGRQQDDIRADRLAVEDGAGGALPVVENAFRLSVRPDRE